MAHTIQAPVLGRMVYVTGSPVRAGKIINVRGMTCTVKFINGTTGDVHQYSLRDLVALRDDTEKKLNTHNATIKKVQAL